MDFAKRTYELGWVPDSDEVNYPENGLLRMDNLILDELGVLANRQGSAKINSTAFADIDVHSLFTVVRSGTRYRYAGATNAVYRNGTSIISGVNGSNDIFFGSYLGQTLIARGTTKRKDDGSTVRNLGIAMTGGAPTVVAALAGNTKQFANWDISETANHQIIEDDGRGLFYSQDHDGTANGAIEIQADLVTLKSILQRNYASDQDFSQYSGPVAGADTDLVETWVLIENSAAVVMVVLFIDVNDNTYQQDYYFKQWLIGGSQAPPQTTPGSGSGDSGSGSGSGGNVGGPNDPGDNPDPPLI